MVSTGMKIAVLVCGEPRYTELAGQVFRKYQTSHQFDVFVHSWKTVTSQRVGKDQSIPLTQVNPDFTNWKPKKIQVDGIEILEPIYDAVLHENIQTDDPDLAWVARPASLHHYFQHNSLFLRIFGQHFSYARAAKLMEPYADQYDFVIRIRHDLVLREDFHESLTAIFEYAKVYDGTYEDNGVLATNIYSAKATAYRGMNLIDDFLLMGTPRAVLAQTNDMKNSVVDLCKYLPKVFKGFMAIHHRIWIHMAERKGINVIPLCIGHSTSLPAVDATIIRPGLEHLPFESIKYPVVKENFERFKNQTSGRP